MNWFQQSWALIVSWAATLAAIVVAIRAIYAAERDRKALEQVDLEREKLTLEVKRLRNSPELVADRRAIYERLRKVLAEIIGPGAVTLDQVSTLHEISHDTEFRYPPEIVESMRALIISAVKVHVSGQGLARGPHQVSDGEWHRIVAENSDALLEIVAFQHGLAERFRSYLSL